MATLHVRVTLVSQEVTLLPQGDIGCVALHGHHHLYNVPPRPKCVRNLTIAHQISLNCTKSHHISLNLTKSH